MQVPMEFSVKFLRENGDNLQSRRNFRHAVHQGKKLFGRNSPVFIFPQNKYLFSFTENNNTTNNDDNNNNRK